MKNTILAAVAISASAGLASAQLTHTFDLSGLASEGSFGANFLITSLVHDFGGAGFVSQVSWDVTFEAFNPSYASEAQIAIDTTDDTSFDADIDPGDYGAPDAPGVFSYSGTIAANSVSSDGLVYLTLYESFNDTSVNPDAVYAQGSWVTVTFVPAPGALALLGLGGLATVRRRR